MLPQQRGSILDRDGALLAMSVEAFAVVANPRFVPDKAGAARALAPVLGSEAARLKGRLSTKRGFVYLARQVDLAQADRIRALDIPGVGVYPESKRLYPGGPLAAHVLGFVGLDHEGLAGMESRYDRLLAGSPGEILMERDPDGRFIPVGKSRETPPVAGDDLVITIDREIQYAAEAYLAKAVGAFGAKGGAVVVMRSDSGEILGLANLPTFDPNRFGSASKEARRNRALIDVYEPGSANKVITAAAALESGTVGLTDVFSVPDSLPFAGKTFRDAHPHPRLDLTLSGIIQRSSNVGTIKIATSMGKERLHDYLRRFGYGKPTGVEFPGEAAGILPPPQRWWKNSLPTIAIGQGVAVTLMQIVSVYSTVANGGVRVQPRLVAATIDARGRRHEPPPPPSRRVIEEATAKELTGILLSVVEGEDGTGSQAAVAGYRVAGKTGTAEKVKTGERGYEGYVASFIGFGPMVAVGAGRRADGPRLVVGVMLDDPRPIWGGVTAAPVFREVMKFALSHLGIGPG
ncbi:MAG: peptidoglycan D,D-transpeptidase FtsI family protein, partial [Acidimicrobiales bacterium]